ncbi:MAG: HlyD family efflux transporter periplasmic adaptor subunit [Pseudorhodobacter sp.]|nr:HlyD family efflux transporter periplasmic adaptor subunit [Pseudorhodobacter sp.]
MRIGSVVAGGLVVMALAGAVFWALRADPLPVDLAPVTIGPMQVTVTEEGMTRVRDTWSVTAPITGTVESLPVQVGDCVTKDKSKVARIRPAASALLDAWLRQQVEAGVADAQAAVRLAEVTLAQAQVQSAYANSQLKRNWDLAHRGTIPARVLEDSQQRAKAG